MTRSAPRIAATLRGRATSRPERGEFPGRVHDGRTGVTSSLVRPFASVFSRNRRERRFFSQLVLIHTGLPGNLANASCNRKWPRLHLLLFQSFLPERRASAWATRHRRTRTSRRRLLTRRRPRRRASPRPNRSRLPRNEQWVAEPTMTWVRHSKATACAPG